MSISFSIPAVLISLLGQIPHTFAYIIYLDATTEVVSHTNKDINPIWFSRPRNSRGTQLPERPTSHAGMSRNVIDSAGFSRPERRSPETIESHVLAPKNDVNGSKKIRLKSRIGIFCFALWELCAQPQLAGEGARQPPLRHPSYRNHKDHKALAQHAFWCGIVVEHCNLP